MKTKHILFVLLFVSTLVGCHSSEAQVLNPYYFHGARVGVLQVTNASPGQKEIERDSVNSGTTVLVPTTSYAYWQADSQKLSGSYKSATIQMTITKASGTLAGSIYLQGSVDGTQWQNINDTATIANGSTYTFQWELPGRTRYGNGGKYNALPVPYMTPGVLPWLYYRVYIAGTGTWCGTYYTAACLRQ